MINLLGSLGTGLVCGWLTGMIACQGTRSARNILLLSGANLLIAIGIFFKYDWSSGLVFAGSMVIALLLFFGWRKLLKNHSNT